ncbi:STAS domain-containing protein [Actinacidiphila sp. ITFR-21]|uniref:STAS domain-containing protein n=1 Tax=Actinacidiphila sp. ITFR-21 TaxID=3075199 RepID=UPI00288B41C6|nr:STAS domain-containing protein [Streptomyces sp. ITFR-21]WNI14464.1 STAS domain-containing protein [Streptomyces sp. ITFR-21]
MSTHGDSSQSRPATGSVPVVAAHGDLDIENLAPLRQALETAAEQPVVVLDAGGVTFADSSFLSVLLAVRQRTDLRVAAAPAQMLRLLGITGADRIIPLYPTVAEAAKTERVDDCTG